MNKIMPKLLKTFLIGSFILIGWNTSYSQKSNQEKDAFFNIIKTQKIQSDTTVVWKNFGPGMSGYNEEFWCHPTDTNVMFMGPDMHVSYGTWDNGKSWQTIKDCDGDGLDMVRVHDIQFSLVNPDYGVALEREGKVFESKNRGRTWTQISDIGKAHTKIAIHPTNDSIWFVGAGDFWNVKENHRTLAKPNGNIHSRADYGYVWKTTDRGANWAKVATSISNNLDVGRILFNPNNPDKMIMATSYGVYLSADGGDIWTAGNVGLPNNLPRDLTSFYDKTTGEFILYLVVQTVYEPNGSTINAKGGVYKSTDSGVSWTSITGNLGFDISAITNYAVRDGYHRTVSHWLGISKSASQSTYSVYPSNTMSVYNRIVVNPLNKNEIYVSHNKKHDFGFGPGDLWKTEDGGQSWFACARNGKYWMDENDKSYWNGRGNPIGTNLKFSHVQREMDEGSENSGNRMLAINAKGQVFIGVAQQTLRSNDKGANWQQVDDYETAEGSNAWVGRGDSNLPGRFMLHETGIPGRALFCSGEHGLWETADLGDYSGKDVVAVKQIEGQVHDHDGNLASHSTSTVAVHPNNPNIIYILSCRQEHRGKLRKTIDGGKTWNNIATIFEASNNSWENVPFQSSLMIDPKNPDNMYFCATRKVVQEVGSSPDESILTKGGYGVYRSTDGGYNWSLSNSGLPANVSVRRLCMDPANSSIIYAALNQFGNNDLGGLYKSVDGAKTWKKESIPTEIKSVNNLFIDRNTKYRFLSGGSRSGSFDAGGVWRSKDEGTSWEKIFIAPYVWQTEVSPVNSNIIIISVPAQIPNLTDQFKNPGIYLSKDDGTTWAKINKGIGQPNKMVDVKPDPYNEGVIWCAGWGSGWFKALIKNDKVKAVCKNAELFENEEVTLYGLGSIGFQLTYEWIAPDGISLSATDKNKTTFTAPKVNKDSTFIITLVVSNDLGKDSLDVIIQVKNNVTTAIQMIDDESVRIFPNPVVDGKLRISGSDEHVKYLIHNIQGKTVQLGTLEQGLIDVSQLNSGVYVITITNRVSYVIRKFMINR
ncbi:hypothetical protein BZG02_15060 [Labilibaculum filiforme]|uniref:Secretion system C-terminal sorting domain-containing protein n=1 Tax=Labilibaculum filiforme TaxID=1940526 RepID=A0A2N3HUL5_9BACT|nr:T9SS type A sorting domain-containing protein [Labilibaculum filiforme]PKQ61739.1 hypothetical protein BZG02_15060 [Labilibaculum filiforme]